MKSSNTQSFKLYNSSATFSFIYFIEAKPLYIELLSLSGWYVALEYLNLGLYSFIPKYSNSFVKLVVLLSSPVNLLNTVA